MPKAKSASVAPSRQTSEHMSVTVRQIDNGYIICRSTDGPKGYKYNETYSASKPKIEIPAVKSARAAAPKAAPKRR